MSYVTANIQGGLGNQLFQIFTALAYARKYGKKITFDTSQSMVCHAAKRNTYWGTLLNHYFSNEHVRNFTCYKEKSFMYHSIPNIKGNVLLDGYFQSFYYFEELKPLIRCILYSNSDIMKSVNEKYDTLPDGRKIAIHVRRGDYLQYPDIHVQVSLKYYEKAIKYFEDLEDSPTTFVVFSDDIPWCKKVFPDSFMYIEGKDEIIDFLLMSKMDHFIIANSSFSLWASYLGEHLHKKTIAPQTWFGKNGPSRWSTIYHDSCIPCES